MDVGNGLRQKIMTDMALPNTMVKLSVPTACRIFLLMVQLLKDYLFATVVIIQVVAILHIFGWALIKTIKLIIETRAESVVVQEKVLNASAA